ncbi:hypothetical protein HYH02_001073 [Chlamydomonas schloesseri]|uniref:GTP cyclohydrolase 1 n=1 Tax=Chlamydomonas schloesseri TaxID=2026947 RepID=A0A835WU46_9CHLO|nr:hypothetical protein HYH02_001073 [Chlamydomonas schloesseri]|eukprot:KAG2454032.1 hypothetical protein HYH02_001073 [Chlamydomonas schloesseri]
MAPCRDKDKVARMEQAVRVLIHGLGEDLEREGLRDTPKRVAKALLDCTQGYHQDTSSTLGTALFHEPIVHHGDEGVVLVRDIDFASTSEETLLPFHGRCHVAYRPKDGVVLGLSKLARLTKQYAKRLQTQERLAAEVAHALQQSLECYGVAVVLQARHLSNAAAPEQRTSACVSGVFASKGSSHLEELLSLLDLEDLPPAAVHNLDLCPRYAQRQPAPAASPAAASTAAAASAPACNGTGCALHHGHPAHHVHHGHHTHHHADGGVAAPGTPDPSEKDTDGDSDDLVLEAPCACDEMEGAVQQLIAELGENPARPGLAGSARRYVMSLLASTSGYTQQAPAPLGGAAGAGAGMGAGAPRQAADGTGSRGDAGAAGQQQAEGEAGAGGAGVRPAGCSRCCCTGDLASALSQHERQHAASGANGLVARLEKEGCSARAASGQQAGAGPLSSVVTMRLPFSSQCEHHMLPFYGELMVAYVADCSSGSSSSAAAPPSEGGATAAAACGSAHHPLPLPRAAVEQVVTMYTQRLQVQERITHQVADAVEVMLLRQRQRPQAGQGQQEQGHEWQRQEPCSADGQAGVEGDSEAGGGVMVVCDAAHMCMVARGVENHSGSTTSFAVRGAFASRPDMRRQVLRLFRDKQ